MNNFLLQKILLGVFLFILTVLLNTLLRPIPVNKPVQTIQKAKPIETNKEKKEYTQALTNNQLAALFLAFPLGGMVWVTSYSLYNNRKKIKKIATIERESKVVFN